MNFKKIKDAIEADTGLEIKVDEPLRTYTSFGIGGPATLLAKVGDAAVAAKVLALCYKFDLPVLVIGGGTNLLVSDSGFEGFTLLPAFNGIDIDNNERIIRAGATVTAADTVSFAVEHELGGLEFAAGLPGSIGGAVAGNAGCFGSSFGDKLLRAQIIDNNGNVKWVDKQWFEFAYRHSAVQQKNAIITQVEFNVETADREYLKEVSEKHIELRRTKHPSFDIKTAGSYFKNLDPLKDGERRRAAGALLDAAGAKYESVGDAAVFEKHANIIVNRGNAAAVDVLKLEARLQKMVEEKFGEKLQPEVRFVGERPLDL